MIGAYAMGVVTGLVLMWWGSDNAKREIDRALDSSGIRRSEFISLKDRVKELERR